MQEIAPIQYNFKIIDFAPICKDISRSIINDLYAYNLLDKPKLTRDIKRLMLHHTIHQICEYFLNKSRKTPTFIYFVRDSYDTELHSIFGKDIINEWLYLTIMRIKKLLPIRIYVGIDTFAAINAQINDGGGDGIEFLHSLRNYADCHNTEKFTFSRLRSYIERNDLTFLSEEYFNRIKTKQLLFV